MITVGVHLKSGSTWHFIEPKVEVKPQPSLPMPSGGLMTHIRFRRYLALALLALSAIYSFASFGQIPSMQAIHDQLAIDKAQGLDCEYVEQRAYIAIVAALAQQSGADEPLLHHPAWEAQMQPQVLSDCGLLQLAQATGPTIAQFNALQSQVNTMQGQITAIQQQLAGSPSPPLPSSISPDGSTLTLGQSGSLTTADGVWTFATGGQGDILLNGASAAGGVGVELLVKNGGKMYTRNSGSVWYAWNSPGWTALAAAP